jgi:hypothetical protein
LKVYEIYSSLVGDSMVWSGFVLGWVCLVGFLWLCKLISCELYGQSRVKLRSTRDISQWYTMLSHPALQLNRICDGYDRQPILVEFSGVCK